MVVAMACWEGTRMPGLLRFAAACLPARLPEEMRAEQGSSAGAQVCGTCCGGPTDLL